MREIDNIIIQEGYRPATAAYWKELTARLEKNLPHRFDEDENGEDGEDGAGKKNKSGKRPTGPRGPGTVTTRGNGSEKGSTFYVPPERKQAMVDGGIWDDPGRRAKQIKAYMAYDTQHAQEQR